jgi:ribosome recycling factor
MTGGIGVLEEIYKDTRERMKKAVEVTKCDLSAVRTGKASPALLNKVKVEYCGALLPINQVATISTPEARLILIRPWDREALDAIQRAILSSDLGLVPTSDGSVIRINIPPLTEERRKELDKLIKRRAEEGRVAIRNVRRDSNNLIKKMEREKEISEDESKKGIEEIQKLTEEHIEEINRILKIKEKEILEF